MSLNIPESNHQRIVIVGAGFAGLTLARKLTKSNFQIVLIDKNNFHQFQPLYYQVAMAGLEPSSISFPIRKIFQRHRNVVIRMAEVLEVNPSARQILTNLGELDYDHLVIATGVDTNYYGNQEIEDQAYPLKSVEEALYLRNAVLKDYEAALVQKNFDERQYLVDIVIVGGGPTGVELAGSLAEMKEYILPKDYPEIDASEVDIYLVEGADRILPTMSKEASKKAEKFLSKLGVKIVLNQFVTAYEDHVVKTSGNMEIPCNKMIWAAGIIGKRIPGLPDKIYVKGNRMATDRHTQVIGLEHIYALGDIAMMSTDKYADGHPQMAQGAIQQARHLAKYLKSIEKGKEVKPFVFKDLGALATIGRNKAVADLPGVKFQGFFAWILWLVVHLKSILGVRNKLIVLINWIWNYVTYDQSLRIIVRHKGDQHEEQEEHKKTAA